MFKGLFGLGSKSETSNVAVQEKPPTPVQTSPTPAPVSQKKSRKKTAKSSSPSQTSAKFPISIAEKTLAEKYRDSFGDNSLVTLCADSTSKGNIELVIRTAYQQVFGNAHFMESERLSQAESEIRFGQITVRDFIRQLATSERYRTLFWDKYSTPVFVELNFKHLLGRAPANYQEVSQHMKLLAESGFEAEIDSYLDSEEYSENFGDFSVPYFRGYESQTGKNNVGFNHAFSIAGMACSSDKSLYINASSKLEKNLIQNNSTNIPLIRPIPKSYPASFAPAPEPRIPKEYRDMAFDILKGLRENPNFKIKRYY